MFSGGSLCPRPHHSQQQQQQHTHTHTLTLLQENPWVKDEMQVNMAYLAVVTCAAVNGVAAIHSEIVKADIFNDFYKLFPEK